MPYEKVPLIQVEPPGPKARAVVEKDHRFCSPSYTRPYPFVMARGEGAVVEDVDGNVYLDFTSGVAVLNTGHCHPEVVRAIQQQAVAFTHMAGTDFYYSLMADLAERLARLPGEGEWRVFFTNSGTESIEAAMKLARWVTGRTDFIAFYGAFHGRTYGSLALTASKAVHKRRFGPSVGVVHHAPYPNPYRPFGQVPPERCTDATLAFIEDYILKRAAHPDDIAAVIVEPIQGEGGYIFPPPDFLPRLRELTDKYGILLIVDEVQTGMGRTGRWFAYQHSGIQPDIIAVAKAIASGLPLGCILARSHLMTWPTGAHANTFGANPIACAAALKTLDLLQGGLMERARTLGEYLRDRLRALMDRHRTVGRVDGLGLMVGVELVMDRTHRQPFPALRDEVVHRCFRRGLLLLGCGDSTIRFIPPLVVEREQIDTAVALFSEVLGECEAAAEKYGG
jgi:4-aminobutyrate aminotransferase